MIGQSFGVIRYAEREGQVAWCGIRLTAGEQFDTFMSREVSSRLFDQEGSAEFEKHLRGLASTGFMIESLNAVLSAEAFESRDWAIAEALAEAYLANEHNVVWPWNMERDKRNPFASLPGADLVGFKEIENETLLVLGEVKSSADLDSPPSVMTGRSGMAHQLDRLAHDLTIICQLLKWLMPRCKNTACWDQFNASTMKLLSSGNRAIELFGILVRDTEPNVADLQARGNTLAGKLVEPTNCQLVALYLPCPISELPTRVSGSGS